MAHDSVTKNVKKQGKALLYIYNNVWIGKRVKIILLDNPLKENE